MWRSNCVLPRTRGNWSSSRFHHISSTITRYLETKYPLGTQSPNRSLVLDWRFVSSSHSILELVCMLIKRQSLHHHWVANSGSPHGQCRRFHLLERLPWSALCARCITLNRLLLCTSSTRCVPSMAGSVS